MVIHNLGVFQCNFHLRNWMKSCCWRLPWMDDSHLHWAGSTETMSTDTSSLQLISDTQPLLHWNTAMCDRDRVQLHQTTSSWWKISFCINTLMTHWHATNTLKQTNTLMTHQHTNCISMTFYLFFDKIQLPFAGEVHMLWFLYILCSTRFTRIVFAFVLDIFVLNICKINN